MTPGHLYESGDGGHVKDEGRHLEGSWEEASRGEGCAERVNRTRARRLRKGSSPSKGRKLNKGDEAIHLLPQETGQ